MTPAERAAALVSAWYAEPDNDEATLETRITDAITDAITAAEAAEREACFLALSALRGSMLENGEPSCARGVGAAMGVVRHRGIVNG